MNNSIPEKVARGLIAELLGDIKYEGADEQFYHADKIAERVHARASQVGLAWVPEIANGLQELRLVGKEREIIANEIAQAAFYFARSAEGIYQRGSTRIDMRDGLFEMQALYRARARNDRWDSMSARCNLSRQFRKMILDESDVDVPKANGLKPVDIICKLRGKGGHAEGQGNLLQCYPCWFKDISENVDPNAAPLVGGLHSPVEGPYYHLPPSMGDVLPCGCASLIPDLDAFGLFENGDHFLPRSAIAKDLAHTFEHWPSGPKAPFYNLGGDLVIVRCKNNAWRHLRCGQSANPEDYKYPEDRIATASD